MRWDLELRAGLLPARVAHAWRRFVGHVELEAEEDLPVLDARRGEEVLPKALVDHLSAAGSSLGTWDSAGRSKASTPD